MRIRVCTSDYQECFVKKHSICSHFILFPSPAEFLRKYRIQCASLHAECGVVPFYQLSSGSRVRALPERAPIAKWSRYKTGLVLDILALCYLYFLTQYPGRGYCSLEGGQLLSMGFRSAWPSLPPQVQTPFSASTANSAESFLAELCRNATVQKCVIYPISRTFLIT